MYTNMKNVVKRQFAKDDPHQFHIDENPNICDVRDKTLIDQGTVDEPKFKHSRKNPNQLRKGSPEPPSVSSKHNHNKQKHTFICGECGKGFTSEINKKIHIRIHTGERPYKCNVCGATFAQKQSLKVHMPIHTGNYPFACDQPNCNFICTSKCYLEKHKCGKMHARENLPLQNTKKPFVCGNSRQSFDSQKKIKVHMIKHTADYPFKCHQPNCKYKFRAKQKLEDHKRSKHTGERPFICYECGKGFASTNALKSHTVTHTTDYQFKCDQPNCTWKFHTKQTLENHKRSKHTGERPFICYECGKGFASTVALYSHTITHTGNYPYSCEICNRKFITKTYFTSHQQKHEGENLSKKRKGKKKEDMGHKPDEAFNQTRAITSIKYEQNAPMKCKVFNNGDIYDTCQEGVHAAEISYNCEESNISLSSMELVNHSRDMNSVENQIKHKNLLPLPERDDLHGFHAEVSAINMLPSNTENSVNLIKPTHQFTINADIYPNELDCAKPQLTRIILQPEKLKKFKNLRKPQTLSKLELNEEDSFTLQVSSVIPVSPSTVSGRGSVKHSEQQNLQRADLTNLNSINLQMPPATFSLTSDQHSQYVEDPTILENIKQQKAQINPVRCCTKHSTSSVKQICDQEDIQLVEDLTRLYPSKLQKLQTVSSCLSTESSKCCLKYTDQQTFPADSSLLQVMPITGPLSRVESASLDKEIDRQTIRTVLEPVILLEDISTRDPLTHLAKRDKSVARRVNDENNLSIADLIHLYDNNLNKQRILPFLIRENSALLVNQRYQQTFQTSLSNSSLKKNADSEIEVIDISLEKSPIKLLYSATESSTSCRELINDQNSQSTIEVVDITDNLQQTLSTNSQHSPAHSTVSFRNRIHDQSLVPEVLDLETDELHASPTHPQASMGKSDGKLVQQFDYNNLQSVIEIIYLDE